jgi:mRNA interferase HigB
MLENGFANFNELKSVYTSASLIADEKVVFNIKGNDFGLVVQFSFTFKSIQIKWFRMHKEYDKIDVKTINFK